MSPRRSVAEARHTHDRILACGVAVASVDGLEGLTIGRLATELGLSKGGILGHFGTKEALQLATLRRAATLFSRLVWAPVEHERPGLARLRAVCDSWARYLVEEREIFPGGCVFATASVEFDARDGAVRDEVARLLRVWRVRLAHDLRVAIEAGELAAGTDVEQVVFELDGIFLALNQQLQLFRDERSVERARRAWERLLS
ncbi:TetR/AcrR family transcriptional regulator [Nonomuraea sp. NPDC050663]|uniref:TetR/AcrR family transcriptional regulator n=1 Tax=Nonomuraea sp. NPDC050663 TaxID=3364370 RepID=UPI003787FB2C